MRLERIHEIEESVLMNSRKIWKENQELIKPTLLLIYRFIHKCSREGCYNHNAEDITRQLPECPAKSLLITYVYQMENHSSDMKEDIEFINKIFDRKILAAGDNEAEQFCYILLKECVFNKFNVHLRWLVYYEKFGENATFSDGPEEQMTVEGIINYLTGFFNYEDGLEVQKYLLEARSQDEKEDCTHLKCVLKESKEMIEKSRGYIEDKRNEIIRYKETIPLDTTEMLQSIFDSISEKIRKMCDREIMKLSCTSNNRSFAALCIAVDAEALYRLLNNIPLRLCDMFLKIEIPDLYKECIEAPEALDSILLTEITLLFQMGGK